MITHMHAYFAATGGPGTVLPRIDTVALTDETAAPMTVLYHHTDKRWKMVDSQGNVYAEADKPGELADWMGEYLESLDGEVA